jgi:hypothetical protein
VQQRTYDSFIEKIFSQGNTNWKKTEIVRKANKTQIVKLACFVIKMFYHQTGKAFFKC